MRKKRVTRERPAGFTGCRGFCRIGNAKPESWRLKIPFPLPLKREKHSGVRDKSRKEEEKMKRRMASLLAVAALFLSLCGCGGAVDPDRHGSGGEIGASPSTGTGPSSSKTGGQPGSGTGRASGQTGTTASQTAATGTGTTTRALEVLGRGNNIWKEVPINDTKGEYGIIKSCAPILDPQKIITNADYIFSGTVTSRKEYEIFWTDKDGKQWGPYEGAIIEVKVNHDYYGQSPVEGNTIKIYYPDSLSVEFEDVVWMKDQGEYVFITQALDEEFVQRRNKESSDDGSRPEKYADVYIGRYYNTAVIDNGTVFTHRGYFDWNKDIMKKVKPNAKTDKIPARLIERGAYIALDKQDFDEAFNQILENPETLPTAETIFAPDETTSGQTEATTGQTEMKTTAAATTAAATGQTTTETPGAGTGKLTTATDEG